MSNQKIPNATINAEVDPELLNNLDILISMEALENEESWDYLMSVEAESTSIEELDQINQEDLSLGGDEANTSSGLLQPRAPKAKEKKGDL